VGENERMLEHIRIGRSIDPDHPRVRNAIAHELQVFGRIEDAIAEREKIIQKDPANFVLRITMVNDLLWAQRFEDARSELDKLADLIAFRHLHSAPTLTTIARVRILAGDGHAAAATAEAMPDSIEREQLMALSRYALGEEAGADAALEALISGADDQFGAFYVSEVYAYRGNRPEAMAWLNRIRFEQDCVDQLLTDHVYFSPFLASLEDFPAWETYRAGVLQLKERCALGLDLEAA
jgi:tetratricopeptide (TPR) repeat protein